jgi:broad-specificity NMP kinase
MRTIIPGPPGTGKTHHLINHYLKKEVEEYKTRNSLKNANKSIHYNFIQ